MGAPLPSLPETRNQLCETRLKRRTSKRYIADFLGVGAILKRSIKYQKRMIGQV
jgi:hypothetical protein